MMTPPSSSQVSAPSASPMPFAPHKEETMMVKYPHSPWDDPIQYTAKDFVAIEDVRDLLPRY